MRAPVNGVRWACLLAAGVTAMSGCVVAAVGAGAGAFGGAVVMADRRSTGIQLEDAQIEHRINAALSDRFDRESMRVDVTSYDQDVLLAGVVPQEKDRLDAENMASAAENVHHVTNELTIGSRAGLSSQGDDSLLAAKVRTALLEVKELPPGVVKVSCTFASIYLFGKVSEEEADRAKQASSQVSGVKRVVVLFEILSPEERARYTTQKS